VVRSRREGGQWAERAGAVPRCAGTAPPAGAVQAQRAEQRAHHDPPAVLVPVRDSAVRAGDLVGQRGAHLMLDHRVLHRGEQVLGFLQLQAHGVRRQRLPGQGEHLAHRRLAVVIGMQHDLHGDLHAALAPVVDSAARARFSVRRSNRSTPRSGNKASEFVAGFCPTGGHETAHRAVGAWAEPPRRVVTDGDHGLVVVITACASGSVTATGSSHFTERWGHEHDSVRLPAGLSGLSLLLRCGRSRGAKGQRCCHLPWRWSIWVSLAWAPARLPRSPSTSPSQPPSSASAMRSTMLSRMSTTGGPVGSGRAKMSGAARPPWTKKPGGSPCTAVNRASFRREEVLERLSISGRQVGPRHR